MLESGMATQPSLSNRIQAAVEGRDMPSVECADRPTGHVERATNHVTRMIHMVNAISAGFSENANRTFGPVPEANAKEPGIEVPSGDIYGLYSQLELLEARIRDCNDQAERFGSL